MRTDKSGMTIVIIGFLFMLMTNSEGITQIQEDQFILGNIIKQKSIIMNEERTILVSLPQSYDRSDQYYPVLYLFDAESHFYYTAGLVRFLSDNAGIPELIVVGIQNIDRNRDFTPTKTETIPASGNAETFIRYIKEEVIAFVEKKYRAGNFRIMTGHSLGGLFALYVLGHHPDLFRAYIAVAPWLIYDNHFIVKDMEKTLPQLQSGKKFLYMTLGHEPDIFPDMENIKEILTQHAPKDLEWSYQLFSQEDHNTVPLNSLFYGLKTLFRDWSVTDDLAARGADSITRHFNRLSEESGIRIKLPENRLNALGYRYLGQKKIKEAIAVFLYNTRLYPESANTYDSLGDAYEADGNSIKAIENAEKALEILKINSDLDDKTQEGISTSAIGKLQRLKK